MKPPAGIYIHWPFCERKCPYCDFYTFGREHPAFDKTAPYLAALLDEIRSAPRRFGWEAAQPRVDSIYFGGGTPSLMGADVLEKVLAALRGVTHIADDTEITLEVNPTTAEAAGIPHFLSRGVNRFSVGCQSFNDRLLKELGRVHDAATTRRALAHLRAAGAANLSLDIIFGVPTQTMDDLERDIEALLSFAPEHLSAYGLTLHDGTPYARWAREGKIKPPGDDTQAEMFELLMRRFEEAGYVHYEISNWAKPGHESRHNSKYWRDCDVLAFGVSAHGVRGGKRFENPRALEEYVKIDGRRLAMGLDAPRDERARGGEIMMLALRRVAGASWGELQAWMSLDVRDFYAAEIWDLQQEGLVIIDAQNIRLTAKGLMIADTVFERFF